MGIILYHCLYLVEKADENKNFSTDNLWEAGKSLALKCGDALLGIGKGIRGEVAWIQDLFPSTSPHSSWELQYGGGGIKGY